MGHVNATNGPSRLNYGCLTAQIFPPASSNPIAAADRARRIQSDHSQRPQHHQAGIIVKATAAMLRCRMHQCINHFSRARAISLC
jgi:hypothetical protein